MEPDPRPRLRALGPGPWAPGPGAPGPWSRGSRAPGLELRAGGLVPRMPNVYPTYTQTIPKPSPATRCPNGRANLDREQPSLTWARGPGPRGLSVGPSPVDVLPGAQVGPVAYRSRFFSLSEYVNHGRKWVNTHMPGKRCGNMKKCRKALNHIAKFENRFRIAPGPTWAPGNTNEKRANMFWSDGFGDPPNLENEEHARARRGLRKPGRPQHLRELRGGS